VKSPRARKAIAAVALLTLAVAAWSFAHAKSEEQVNRARFAADGSVTRPIEWRQWVHVGSRYKPIGLNILDQKLTKTPGVPGDRPVAGRESDRQRVYRRPGRTRMR
jgi:hypothetical protein